MISYLISKEHFSNEMLTFTNGGFEYVCTMGDFIDREHKLITSRNVERIISQCAGSFEGDSIDLTTNLLVADSLETAISLINSEDKYTPTTKVDISNNEITLDVQQICITRIEYDESKISNFKDFSFKDLEDWEDIKSFTGDCVFSDEQWNKLNF